MFGITLLEFVSAVKEAALAVAAASSFWAVWLGISSRKADLFVADILRRRIISLLQPLFTAGTAAAFAAWGLACLLIEVSAHEGVTLHPTSVEVAAATSLTGWAFAGLGLALLLIHWTSRNRPEYFYANPDRIYIFPLFASLILVSFPAWRGQWDAGQWFYFGHSFHAVFTLGTVITLDYLLLRIKVLEERRIFYRYLLPISAVIWMGLGMDFAGSFLVLDEALRLTPKFYFLQTLIGVLLINGAFLAGPVTEKLITAAGGGVRLSRGWATAMSVSGAISIVSWITIKFTDFFRGLTLDYYGLLGVYAIILTVAIITSLSLRDREFKELLQ